MDDLDRRLVRLLRQDGRASFIDLARRTEVSEATVRARVKKLVDEGTIRQFTVRTSGADVRALVEVQVRANVQTGPIAQAIRQWEGVETVWEVTGDNDLVVVAECPTTETLNQIIDRIRDIEGAVATRSRLILKEHG